MPRPDFTTLHRQLRETASTVAPAIQLTVRRKGRVIFSRAYGWLDPDTRQHPTTNQTLFDLASVTKLFVVTTFMALTEAGQLSLDQPVAGVLPELDEIRTIQPYEDPLGSAAWVTLGETGSVKAGEVTFRHFLTHTSGLPAWRPLYRQPSAKAARDMALTTFFAYPTGTRVVYSDIGLILLGIAIERTTGLSLDGAVRQAVTGPLDLQRTRYRPLHARHDAVDNANIAPTEFCAWRGRRIAGEVHDENAYRLDGVAGHAGLFSTADDVATFGQMFLDRCGGALAVPHDDVRLSAETVGAMRRLQTPGMAIRRGLGFALWDPDPEASSNPFSKTAFGHTGFTGTSLWIDPDRDLVVALLTNEVYNGRQGRKIGPLRLDVHRAIVEAVDGVVDDL
ncbi:MAG: beta-lactamase family protein [Anaerolineae bacterium]|nr:beta-lactamase family protein [Anaerolineae bacterium]